MEHNNINRFEIILLVLLVSLATLSTDLYAPALPLMVPLFHTSPVSIQQSLVSFTYGFAICMLVSGILADGLGRKQTLLIGLSIYSLASLAILFCANLHLLVLLRFFQGLGGCCGTVVARVIVRDKYSDRSAISILALLSSGMACAFITGPIIGSLLMHFFSWRSCFIVMFFLGLLLLLSVKLFLLDSKEASENKNLKFVLQQYQCAFRYKPFLMHTMVISSTWAGFFLIVIEYPFILINQFRFSVLNFGIIFSVILFGYFIGSRVARLLSINNCSPERAVLYGLAIMCSAALIGLTGSRFPSAIIPTISGFLYLVGLGIQIPNSQFSAIAPTEKGSATITSLLYFIEMLFTAIFSHFFKTYFSINTMVLWLYIGVFLGVNFCVFYYAAFAAHDWVFGGGD